MSRMFRFMLILSVLLMSSLACKAVMGDANQAPLIAPPELLPPATRSSEKPQPTPEFEEPGQPEEPSITIGEDVKTEFPLPKDAAEKMDLGNGMISFQTKMSVKDTLEFYRAEFKTQGYKEREITTVITNEMFSIIYDGHKSGQAIVIQAVDIGNGSVNVIIQLQDI